MGIEEHKKEIVNQIRELEKEILEIKLQNDIPPHIIRELQQKLDKLILKNI
jgi:predicted transposase YdaD